MKTNTYDLNLYVIDGKVKVLAHELEFASDGHIQAGGNFLSAFEIPLKRTTRFLWEPIVAFFGEDPTKIYNELDSWYGVDLYDESVPFHTWEDSGVLNTMPPVLDVACSILPTYEMHDWR
jgi:hypothetical protein